MRGYVESAVWAMANKLIAEGFEKIDKGIDKLEKFTIKQFESPIRILAGIGGKVELISGETTAGIGGIISTIITMIFSPVVIGIILIYIMFFSLGNTISGIWSGWTAMFVIIFCVLFALIEFSRTWHEISREEFKKISERGG
jgi:hypothetical protein